MNHDLKIFEEYAHLINSGVKNWEIRKNDRHYQQGDRITFIVIDANGKEIDMKITRFISYVFTGGKFGLDPDYCILSLSKFDGLSLDKMDYIDNRIEQLEQNSVFSSFSEEEEDELRQLKWYKSVIRNYFRV